MTVFDWTKWCMVAFGACQKHLPGLFSAKALKLAMLSGHVTIILLLLFAFKPARKTSIGMSLLMI